MCLFNVFIVYFKVFLKNSDPVIPRIKKKMSSEALKRNYFNMKCHNAGLKRKKLIQEMLNNKEEHKVKMLIF